MFEFAALGMICVLQFGIAQYLVIACEKTFKLGWFDGSLMLIAEL